MKNGHYDDFDIELDDFIDDFGKVDTPSPITKQKKGKKRMKQIGNVEVPQKAFLAVLKLD